MTQTERVEIIRAHFPGYDAPLDSKCEKPKYYGVMRTPQANALIREAEPPVYKFTVRLPRKSHQVMFLLKELGYRNIAEWINECINDLWRRFEEKRKTVPGANGNGLADGNGDESPLEIIGG